MSSVWTNSFSLLPIRSTFKVNLAVQKKLFVVIHNVLAPIVPVLFYSSFICWVSSGCSGSSSDLNSSWNHSGIGGPL